jgi:hypothetical protein
LCLRKAKPRQHASQPGVADSRSPVVILTSATTSLERQWGGQPFPVKTGPQFTAQRVGQPCGRHPVQLVNQPEVSGLLSEAGKYSDDSPGLYQV